MSDTEKIHRWLSQAELDQMLEQAYQRGAEGTMRSSPRPQARPPASLARAPGARITRPAPRVPATTRNSPRGGGWYATWRMGRRAGWADVLVDPRGLEPLTSTLPVSRSPN